MYVFIRCICVIFVITTLSPTDVKAQNFQDIGISELELVDFLANIRSAANRIDHPTLCDLLAYPIQVSRLQSHKTSKYYHVSECKKNFGKIFTEDVLRKMTAVSESDVREIKGMLVVYDGVFWISKYYLSKEPQAATPEQMAFHNSKYWRLKIVDINQL